MTRKTEYDPRDWQTPQQNAQKFVEFLRGTAESALSTSNLEETDRQDLLRGLELVAGGFEQLEQGFVTPHREGRPSHAAHGYMTLHQLMGACFLIGSRATVTDSARGFFLKPFSQGGTEGGKRSGEARRNAREKGWRSEARERITKARNDFPKYSQDKIAQEVSAVWSNEDTPSHASLKNLISEMETAGEIQKMVR